MKARTRLALAALFGFATVTVTAGVMGPVFPPPGGVDYTYSGDADLMGGRTIVFTNLVPKQFMRLWWGPWDANAVQASFSRGLNEPFQPEDQMLFDAFGSKLASGVAFWNGSTVAYSPFGTYTIPTRMTLRVLDMNKKALALDIGEFWMVPTPVVALVPNEGAFAINLAFEGQMGGNWYPMRTLFDSLHTYYGYACRTSFNGGFFYQNTAPIAGTVGLSDYVGSLDGRIVDLEIRDIDTGAIIEKQLVNVDARGNFWLETAAMGRATISVKADHWLRCSSKPVTIGPDGITGLWFRLTNGDVSGDNSIDVQDYALLSVAFGAVPGDPNWLPEADLNGDAEVAIEDYAILSLNYGLMGDE